MFGMARDLGRKKQERRVGRNQLPKGAYTLDKRLVPRVKEVNIKDNGVTVSFKTPCLMKNTLYMMIYLLWTRFLQGQVAKYTLMKLWGLPRCKNLTSFPLCCRLSFSFPVLFSRFCFFFFTPAVNFTDSYTEVKANYVYMHFATLPLFTLAVFGRGLV